MAAVTRLAAYGGPGKPYGSFAGKVSGAVKSSAQVTRLHAYGGPGRLYGAFTKTPSAAGKDSTRITRLDLYGGPGRLYGTFAGKTAATTTSIKSGWPSAPPIAYRQYQEPKRVRIRYTQADAAPVYRTSIHRRLMREDEELLMILIAAAAGGVFE